MWMLIDETIEATSSRIPLSFGLEFFTLHSLQIRFSWGRNLSYRTLLPFPSLPLSLFLL